MSPLSEKQKKPATMNIVVAAIRPWNIKNFHKWKVSAQYKKYLVTSPDQLTDEWLEKINPKYIFFPHWSWIIPSRIHKKYECILFHTADLPKGRGGSPIQNLILRGMYKAKVSAIRVEEGLDTGDIYMKTPIDLSRGSAQEIFEKNSAIVYEMMTKILQKKPTLKPQKGIPLIFKRRKPEESLIPEKLSPREMYDFVRMLDADDYPRAYIEAAGYRIEFKNAKLEKGKLTFETLIK